MNFREVIANIKPRETWSSHSKVITCESDGYIRISIAESELKTNSMGFDEGVEYSLQRPKYSFAEAFEEYEKGKAIQSCEYGGLRYKKLNGYDCVKRRSIDPFTKVDILEIDIQSIRGEWYILDEE